MARPLRSRIDLGLAVLRAKTPPGHPPRTQEEIAAWAGCSKQAIQQIEWRALRRLRRRLLMHHDPVLTELFDHLFENK